MSLTASNRLTRGGINHKILCIALSDPDISNIYNIVDLEQVKYNGKAGGLVETVQDKRQETGECAGVGGINECSGGVDDCCKDECAIEGALQSGSLCYHFSL